MGGSVRCFSVGNLNKVNITRYKNGDIFYTNRSVGILINGKIRVIPLSQPNLRDYVKKDDVQQMIEQALKDRVINE